MYKEKIEKHLRENGWQTHWNENVWIHPEIMKGANLDMCGLSLEQAYKCSLLPANRKHLKNNIQYTPPICPSCNNPMSIVKYKGYYDEFKFFGCLKEHCLDTLEKQDHDKLLKGNYTR